MSSITPSTDVEGPLLLTIAEAARLLGLSEWQVRGLGVDGTLPVSKVRGRWYVPAESVREYVATIAGTA